MDMILMALLKKYVNDSLVGVGALKGAPCTIKSITEITGGNRITFSWVDDEETEHTSTLDVMDGTNGTDGQDGQDGADGADGLGIKSVDINGSNHLIITYDDDTTHDAGELPTSGGGSGLTDDIKNALLNCFANVAWSVPNGQIYYDALEDALNGITPVLPELDAISASKSKTVYTVGDTLSLTDVIVTATYTDSTYADVTEDAEFDTSDVDMDTAGTYSIDISYTERNVTKTTSISISVAVAPVAELTSISATKTKTSYTVGDTLDTDDFTVTASYSTGTTSNVTNSSTITTSGVDMSTAGTYNVPISYTEGGITKTTSVAITVVSSGQNPRGQIALTFTDNKQLSRFDGTTKSKDGYACTEAYTNLVDGMAYTIASSTASGYTVDTVFYDSSKAYVGYVQTKNGTITVPSGARYVRFGCYPIANKNSITFTESAGA